MDQIIPYALGFLSLCSMILMWRSTLLGFMAMGVGGIVYALLERFAHTHY